jgi:ABC-type transport system involved in Fe-S cluster assembly fused permease/ATPase subunit
MTEHSRARLFNITKAQQAVDQNLRSLNQFFIPLTIDLLLGTGMLLANCGWAYCLLFMTTNLAYAYFTVSYSIYRKEGIQKQRVRERRADLQLSEALSNYLNVKVSNTEQY